MLTGGSRTPARVVSAHAGLFSSGNSFTALQVLLNWLNKLLQQNTLPLVPVARLCLFEPRQNKLLQQNTRSRGETRFVERCPDVNR